MNEWSIPHCPMCGTAKVVDGAGSKWRCPNCTQKVELYIPGREYDHPIYEKPFNYKSYRAGKSHRFFVPSKLTSDGELLGYCTTVAGRTRIYLYDEAVVLLQEWDDSKVSYRKRFVPREVSPEKAVATLRAMIRDPGVIAAGPVPEDCVVTPEGYAYLQRMGASPRIVPKRKMMPSADAMRDRFVGEPITSARIKGNVARATSRKNGKRIHTYGGGI